MHLASGKPIAHREIAPVPMTKEVIERAEALAKKDVIPTELSFIFRSGGKFMTNSDALLAGVDNENVTEEEEDDDDKDCDDHDQEDDDESVDQ